MYVCIIYYILYTLYILYTYILYTYICTAEYCWYILYIYQQYSAVYSRIVCRIVYSSTAIYQCYIQLDIYYFEVYTTLEYLLYTTAVYTICSSST